jgi:hypothetical protein
MSYHVHKHAGRYNSAGESPKSAKGCWQDPLTDPYSRRRKAQEKAGFEAAASPFNDKLAILIVNSFIFAGNFKIGRSKASFFVRSSDLMAAHPSYMKKMVVIGMLKRPRIAAKVIVCRSLKKLNRLV